MGALRWGAPALLLLVTCGCGRAYFSWKQERDIEGASRAIVAAQTDSARAQAYATRGRAYSEKARYSRVFKLVSSEEYARLFEAAVKDHDQAVALSPAEAHVYLSRGLTYYDRAALEDLAAPETRLLFDAARHDFTKALERDGRNVEAIDRRALVHTNLGEHDQAIADFTLEMGLDPRLGRHRLADAYCRRGSSLQRAQKANPAIADYEKAIELGGASDACECQPESPLAWLYYEKGDYDRSWEVVRKARASSRWVAPELLEQLKRASGRDR